MKTWNTDLSILDSEVTTVYQEEIKQLITTVILPDSRIVNINCPNAVAIRPGEGDKMPYA